MSRRILRGLRRRARAALGIVDPAALVAASNERLARLEERQKRLESELADARSVLALFDDDPRLHEVSRTRWRTTAPAPHLTWGRELTGDAFVERLVAHGGFGPGRSLLEVGPGYGRLLRSILERGDATAPFGRYLGLDISRQNVDHLSARFGSERVRYQHGDAEVVEIDDRFDLFFSSLTLKHLFPTFEKALANVARFANPRALFVFDLIEGTGTHFEADRITYIRLYPREEIVEILGRLGLELVTFDQVAHDADPDHTRLLVVARKP